MNPQSTGSEGPPRGPTTIQLDGDPNGLALASDGALLIADDNGNRILRYDDDGGVSVLSTLPTAPDRGPGLGQVALLPDGGFVVPRFGFGSAGDVVVGDASGDSRVIAGLDPTRRRIGAAVAADGAVYIAGFVVEGDGRKLGSIWHLDVDAGTEVEVIGGLQKPVGVLVVDGELVVSDQERGEIMSSPLSAPAETTVLAAALPSADLLSAGPNGSVFTGSKDGAVFQVSASGEASVFADGFQEVRGTTYDPVNKRLFVADHDGDESDGVSHQLRIMPVDQ